MTTALLLTLKSAVGLLILAIGMESRFTDIVYLWRQPGLLLRSLLAMYVLVPLVAVLLVISLNLPSGVEIALLILAVSAGAPLLPRKLKFLGREPYIFSLIVLSSLLSILIVPTWLALLGHMFAVQRVLEPNDVALILAKALFLPLVAGMLLRWLFPRLTERIVDRLLGIVGAVFMVCALLLLALHWTLLLEAGWPFLLTLVTMALLALGIGHALGGPHPDGRTALAVACATRHVGVAVLVAATLPGPRTAVLITAYIVTSAVITLPYLRWQRHRNEDITLRSTIA